MFKIYDYSNAQIRDPQVIQHQSAFMVGVLIDNLCVYDNRIKGD